MGCHFNYSKAEAGGSEFKASLSNLTQLYFKLSGSKGEGGGLGIQLTDETLPKVLSLNPSIMFPKIVHVFCVCVQEERENCEVS